MASIWSSLALVAALAAAPAAAGAVTAAAAAAEAPPSQDGALPGQDPAHPPPGSPEDQALWSAGHEVTQAVHVERARATRLQAVLLALRYGDRVDALAAAGDDARRAEALGRRLREAHAAQVTILTARWPVDPYRVCGYPAMELGSMLSGGSEPADVARHRAMLVGCVEQAQASLKLLRDGNDGLEAAMRAADAVLATPAAGAPAEAAARAPAGAGEGRARHAHHGGEPHLEHAHERGERREGR